MRWLGAISKAVTIAALTSTSAYAQDVSRPNVVLILLDDMGWGDLSCYSKDATPTPRIDQLAREGIRFTQAYVSSPICSPSRCSLLTGQWPQRWRITSFINHREANDERGMAQALDLAAPTLARDLQKAGYATGHFGKWHLGGGRDVGDVPLITEYGFDESLTQFEGLGDRLLPLMDKHDGSEPIKNGLGVASEKLGRGKVEWVDRSIMTSRLADRAIQFIDQSVAANKPFYINVWPDDVHSPFFPPKDEIRGGGKRQMYKSVVRATDKQLTKLLDHLRDTPALRANTIVVLMSDNGPEPGAGSAGPFRGTKTNLWEGGIREPFIVWAPSLMSAERIGTVDSTSVISSLDFAPSIRVLAGVANVDGDGQDASAALLGKTPLATRVAPLFWRRPPDRPGTVDNPFPDLAMRDGDWKFLCMSDGSSPQLYDLAKDEGESNNVASEQPDHVAAMTKTLLAWNASMPADRPMTPTTRPTGGGG